MRVLTVLLLAPLLAGCGSYGTSRSGAAKRLDGAGSSFVNPMMQDWSATYHKEKGIAVNYQSKGSGAGIRMATDKEVDFGCTDAPLNPEQLKAAKDKGSDVIHIPVCMGGIVPTYNLEGVPDLVFDGPALIGIFSGDIKTWDDPALKALNPQAKLPNDKISVAYRSDSSGSTFIFTDFLTKIDPSAWKPGKGTAIKFPVGTGSKGSDGVAGFVKKTAGAIGYVELIYALKNGIPFGKVVNPEGKAIKADLKSVTAAAATLDIPDDLCYSLTNAPGEDAYPISGTVWAIAYVRQPAEKATTLHDFLYWITHDGQKATEKLHYASLPESLVKKIEFKLSLLKGK